MPRVIEDNDLTVLGLGLKLFNQTLHCPFRQIILSRSIHVEVGFAWKVPFAGFVPHNPALRRATGVNILESVILHVYIHVFNLHSTETAIANWRGHRCPSVSTRYADAAIALTFDGLAGFAVENRNVSKRAHDFKPYSEAANEDVRRDGRVLWTCLQHRTGCQNHLA
jgi:hypothetical protein